MKNILFSFINSKNFLKLYCYIFILSICLTDVTDDVLEIPLTMIPVDGIAKYRNFKVKQPDPLEKNKISLVDEGIILLNANLLFLANIKIGSNQQEFNLILDTGSPLLWVPEVGSKDEADLNHHFNPSASKTSENTGQYFSIQYGTGSCSGYYYIDNIKYIKNKNFKMIFGVAKETVLNVDNADGIIGLANAYDNENLSFVRMLKNSGVTSSKLFSFKFEGNFKVGMEGKMYIGKHKDFSNSVSCNLVIKKNQYDQYWTGKIDGISLRKFIEISSSSKSFEIIFDTGTNFMLFPMDYLNDLKSQLNKVDCETYEENSQGVQLKCSGKGGSLPDLNLKINGNTLTIPYNYLFSQIGNYYYSNILFISNNLYIIGSAFFLTFHTLFDNDNNKLHFYPMESEYLNKGSYSTTNLIEIFAIIIVIILLGALIGYLVYRFILWKKAKNALQQQDIPYSNYRYF